MKTRTALVLVLVLALSVLGACAKGSYDQARGAHKAGQPEEAIAKYTEAIASPTNDHELFHAYHYRGDAYAETGQADKAYSDYYAAKVISCGLTKRVKGSQDYATGMLVSTSCDEIGDNTMADAGAGLSEDMKSGIRQAVDGQLSRFMQ